VEYITFTVLFLDKPKNRKTSIYIIYINEISCFACIWTCAPKIHRVFSSLKKTAKQKDPKTNTNGGQAHMEAFGDFAHIVAMGIIHHSDA
jgi:hypothetical protein